MRTLKIAVALAVCFAAMATPAFALLDSIEDNSNTNQQGQLQGQQQGIANSGNSMQGQTQGIANSGNSSNTNRNTNTSTNRNTNSQGQDQGQLQGQDQCQAAIAAQGQKMGQAQDMGQSQAADITIEDNRETKGYYLAAPSTSAEMGQRASSVYSIFGGVNIAQTEEGKALMDLLNVIGQLQNAGYLNADEAKAEALAAYKQLKDTTKSKRVLGFLWKTRGNHLLNLFGFAACDDLLGKVGSGPGERKKRERVDTDLSTGNRGNVGP